MKLAPDLTADDETILERLRTLQDRDDVASLLEVPLSRLNHILYAKGGRTRHYREFSIPKPSGGIRTIQAPRGGLKLLQQKLAHVLGVIYEDQYGAKRPSVHGFRRGVSRGIVSNAKRHIGRDHLLRIDLADFFPSITFARVFGLFRSEPFALGQEATTTLAQLCCMDDAIATGAPTSPAISNLICARMDRELQKLAKSCKGVHYTRYADDLVFSSRTTLPSRLVTHYDDVASPGPDIVRVVEGNFFKINPSKTRYFKPPATARVTGLLVGKRVNVDRKFIRRVRSMLRLWEKHGLDSMQREFETREQHRSSGSPFYAPSFPAAVRGRIAFIGHVRGKDDRIYLTQLWHYRRLVDGSAKDATLQLIDGLTTGIRSFGDPELIRRSYAVRDAIAKSVGGEKAANALSNFPSKEWKRLGHLANGTPISASRHLGEFPQNAVRDMTDAERAECETLTQILADWYRQHVSQPGAAARERTLLLPKSARAQSFEG